MFGLSNQPRFRPPAEAESLILQIDIGCPHNQCAFCGMYKDVRYRSRSLDEVLALIDKETRRHPRTRRVFLADGDVMTRSYDELIVILEHLRTGLPRLTRVNAYANGRSICAFSPEQLRSLREQRLHTLYMGLESGDDETLRTMHKPDSSADMIKACLRAQQAGLRMSVMALIGLGGRAHAQRHLQHTIQALNRMQPRLLSLLRVIPIPGTGLDQQAQSGAFSMLSEYASVQEMRDLLDGLRLEGTVFRANHTSNSVPLEGRLPHDQHLLLNALDQLLASGTLDTDGPGVLPLLL